MKIAYVAGLPDKKLAQKLSPLQALPSVTEIHLYRREPFQGNKIFWHPVPAALATHPLLGDLWRMAQLLATVRRCDILIGCHQRFHGVMVAVAALVWKKPAVQVLIGSPKRGYGDWRYRWALRRADAIAVRGDISARQLRDLGYTGPVAIVANPYRMPDSQAVRESERYQLLAVGDYVDAKDYPWMMEVLASVCQRRPGTRLAIAGRGAYRKHLGHQIERLGLEPCVHFPGWQDAAGLDHLYRSCLVFLLTSKTEGLPMVVIEAMAYSLPVVVTDVGELPALVRDGEGVVVAHGDTKTMTDAILELLADPDARRRIGERAHARIVGLSSEYSERAIATQWQHLLEAIG